MTTTWIYPSTFDDAYSHTGPTSNPSRSTTINAEKAIGYNGHLASFIFLVAGLESKFITSEGQILMDEETSFRHHVLLGSGASFMVERAEWNSRSSVGLESNKDSKWGKFLALKYAQRTTDSTNWKQILLEIRALLHEPIRYHPNIIRLLGLSWGATQGTRSVFPVLALEYAEYGTLSHLQTNLDPLPFEVKRKLCHDVSKGLSILHACGIVHGDLKHENVLVFRNKNNEAKVIYTAKLADFGGSVMDLVEGDRRSLHMSTAPYNAPESRDKLDAEQLKCTDVYSFGLLVWRTIVDGEHPFKLPQFTTFTEEQLEDLKRSNTLLPMVKDSVRIHPTTIHDKDMGIVDFVFENTIQATSRDRSLTRAVAALQVAELSEIDNLLKAATDANEAERLSDMTRAPGSHGISKDSLGIYIAKTSYEDYDYQYEGPGYRPSLDNPDPAEFLFEPLRLNGTLDWSLQEAIVRDLEHATIASPDSSTTQISRTMASFSLFRCYVHEFGVIFDPERACHWLRLAALSDDESTENYLAQSWCWRIHRAMGITLDVEISTLRNWMHLGILRGHRKCITESLNISSLITDNDETELWKKGVATYTSALKTVAGGIGMPYFVPRKLRRQYDLQNLDILDQNIQAEFAFRGVDSLDEIFVNHRGDGLLHLAAALGNLAALKHLVEKYKPNIDIANQAKSETPLLSACRGGHLDCAVFLLDSGATPDGSQWAEETPLYWLCAFSEDDVPTIAQKLHAAGASLQNDKKHRGHRLLSQHSWSDSEKLYTLPVSPLSRAVWMQSLPSVRALLTLGADPLENISSFSSTCPVVLASVLTLPRILEVLLLYLDTQTSKITRLFTDMEMLQIAVDKVATAVDTTSLESRLGRCGAEYKSAMFETLEMLHLRDLKTKQWATEGNDHRARAKNTILARMVSLGRVDIVDSLLRLGHSVAGKPDACPILEAIKLNHEAIFRLLVGHGADVLLKVGSLNEGQCSLLQVSADRPGQSQPGLFIPEYLLKMGVPVDPLPDGSRSAFASAIRNQDFGLAELLLQHGANIDFSYRVSYQDVVRWITIFGELIQNPTEKNIESMKYLLRVDGHVKAPIISFPPTSLVSKEDESLTQNRPLPDFIVDKQNSLSILHFAAIHVPQTNPGLLALEKMMKDILSEKTYSAKIDLFHASLGTALWAATACCNMEVVSALLEGGANPNIPFKGLSPLKIALQALETERQPNSGTLNKVARNERLKRFTLIVQRLRNAGAE